MLFYPWRDENKLMGDCDSYEEQFLGLTRDSSFLTTNMKKYSHHSKTLDLTMKALESMELSDLEGDWDQIAPNTQHVEREDEEEGTKPADQFPSVEHKGEDIGQDLGLQPRHSDQTDAIVIMIPDEEFLLLAQSLNCEQRCFLPCFKLAQDTICTVTCIFDRWSWSWEDCSCDCSVSGLITVLQQRDRCESR